MLETQLLNTKEKPFEPTKPESVQSISLLVVWLEGFNHCPLSIGSITRRLHYGPGPLFRGQRSECSFNDALCFIDWLWGGKCFYRCGSECTKMTLHVWGNKLYLEKKSFQMRSSLQPLYVLIMFMNCTLVDTSPLLCVFQFLNKQQSD